MKKIAMVVTGIIVFMSCATTQAGVIVGGTRVVYDGSREESTLTVQNQDKSPWVIQAWVDGNGPTGTEKEVSKPPFAITPALSRLTANGLSIIHISRTGGALPENKESVYWLNIKSIPEYVQSKENRLTIAVDQRIKLIFRPKGISSPTVLDYRKVTFKKDGKKLNVMNPTPYWLTFYSLDIGGSNIKTENVMIPPTGKATYALPENRSAKNINWQLINDYGGHTEVMTSILE